MKYSYPVHTFAFMLGIFSMIQHGWEWMDFQGAIAMSEKLFSGADLFGMEAPTKRTNDRPEAMALIEVLKGMALTLAPSRDHVF